MPQQCRATAEAFTALLKEGKHIEAAEAFNSEDIVSHEDMDGPMAVCRGRAEVKAKSDWWYATHEVHGGSAEGPFVHGDQFIVRFTLDVTNGGDGPVHGARREDRRRALFLRRHVSRGEHPARVWAAPGACLTSRRVRSRPARPHCQARGAP